MRFKNNLFATTLLSDLGQPLPKFLVILKITEMVNYTFKVIITLQEKIESRYPVNSCFIFSSFEDAEDFILGKSKLLEESLKEKKELLVEDLLSNSTKATILATDKSLKRFVSKFNLLNS